MTGRLARLPRGPGWRAQRVERWLELRAAGSSAVQFGGPVLELLDRARSPSTPPCAALGPDLLDDDRDRRRRQRARERSRPRGRR